MPTKPGTKTFPYVASPNTQLQTVADSVDLAAPPDQVWALIGQFGGMWHPLIAKHTADRNGCRAATHDRNDRRQADHRTP